MKEDRYMPMTSVGSGNVQMVSQGVYMFTNQIVNVCFIGDADHWVLIDAGMPKSKDAIIEKSEELFGERTKPAAMILTHGHFDHVGAAEELVEVWDIPVYANKTELPFLTGETSYPAPDPSVEGGMVAKISSLFPSKPVQLKGHVHPLPENGEVPELADWKWVHTPGHTPGHISLFRESDRTLIAGDAFTTVKQDELFDVLTQKKEIAGPPRYFTSDWKAAENSVKKLAELQPNVAATGHGIPMEGKELRFSLTYLADNFKKIAVPNHGNYVD